MALVFFVISALSASGSRFMVRGSTSQNTIFAPKAEKAADVAIQLTGVVMISSPGFTSAARKKYGANAEVRIEEDGKGNIELYLVKDVVKDVEDDSTQISIQEAQEYVEGSEVGDTIELYIWLFIRTPYV